MPNIKDKFLYLNIETYRLDDKYKRTVHDKSYYPDATVINEEHVFRQWYAKQIELMKIWLKNNFKTVKISANKRTLYLTDKTGGKYVGTLCYSWEDPNLC